MLLAEGNGIQIAAATPEMDLDWVRHGLAKVMPDLDPTFGEPVSPRYMEEIVNSPYHGQLVAVDGEIVDSEGRLVAVEDDLRIVGGATLSVILGAGFGAIRGHKADGGHPNGGRKVQLEDYVVAGDLQGRGVGGLLWKGMMGWSAQKGAGQLIFQTERDDARPDLPRGGTIAYYERRGAATPPGCVHMEVEIPKGD
jgi:hypothetical protein